MPATKTTLSLIENINNVAESNSLKIKSLTILDHILHVVFDERLNSKHNFEPFFFFGYNENEHKSVIVEGGIFGDTVVEHMTEFDGKLSPKFVFVEFENFAALGIQHIREEVLDKMPS